MNKKEFLKSHPSLKGKKCWLYEGYEASWIMEEGDEAGLDSVTNQDEIYYKEEDIQKTQIDKQIVEKFIDKIDKEFREDIKEAAKSGDFIINSMLVGANLYITKKLKKELGL